MKKHLLFSLIFVAGCGSNKSFISPIFYSVAHMEGANIVPITVSCGYVNEPCVSVTICNPNDPSQCKTVDNILLDTGSYGLRVFASEIPNVGLTPITSGGGQLAECQNYLDNSADWGPIALAYVQLGDVKTSQPIPIQMIDANFPSTAAPGTGAQNAGCENPDDSPKNAGFNGILGTGPHVADCGSFCSASASNFTYFSCKADGTCTSTAVPQGAPGLHLSSFQVSNPIPYFPTHNNGSALILPAIDSAGAAGANGYLVLGIDTSIATDPNDITVIPTGATTNFTTIFQGHSYPGSFIDSGSNGLFFPNTGLNMPIDSAGFYNPKKITPFQATYQVNGQTHYIDFSIMGSSAAFTPLSPNMAFNNLGAEYNGGFDWGLPFFFGRTVYVGIEGKNSSLGMGPYWAY